MSLDELNTKSLVVSLWDEDSKSRDDYMAGVSDTSIISSGKLVFFLVQIESAASSIFPTQKFGFI